MPQLDMPLDKLKQYTGTNPRPADFDGYWDKALAEMHAIDPKIELKPAEFQVETAECFDLYFTGVRNARIHAKLAKPKARLGKQPAIVQYHGYTGSSGDWHGLLIQTARNYSVAAIDVRGQGGSSEEPGGHKGTTHNGHIIRGLDDSAERLLFRDIFLDCAQLARVMMSFDFVDPDRIGAQGGSQGGALTIAAAALEPRIKRAAALYPYLCDYKRVYEMDLARAGRPYAQIGTFLRTYDPLHKRSQQIFERLGYIDIQFLAARVKAKTLWGVTLMDDICPPSTQFAAINKMTADLETLIYPDFGHETPPGYNDLAYMFMNGL